MIGMVLVTHGRLADEFIAATEHVVGPQDGIRGISIGPEDDMDEGTVGMARDGNRRPQL